MAHLRLISAGRYGWRGSRSMPLWRWTVMCAGLLCGCGGGEENAAPPVAEQQPKLTASAVKPRSKANRPKVTKKKTTTAKTPRRRKKPPGIPITALPEEQFTIIGNVDEFAIAEEPFAAGESFTARAPTGSLSSANYIGAIPGPRPKAGRPIRSRLPAGFAPVPEAGVTDEGWPQRIVCLKDEAEMVFIPAGLFTRGVEGGPEDAAPEHQVQLDSYYIDVHEVTAGQYQRYRRDLSANNERLPKALDPVDDPAIPAVGVRWGEAVQYARWAGKSLPTEAEWETAARGNDAFTYPWGHGKPIWHRPRAPAQIDPAESFRGDRSPFGVMDLAGNAREWCQDWYSARSYQMAVDQAKAGTLFNPEGPRTPVGSKDRTVRVVRGSEEGWEAWRRSGVPMGTRSPTIGFRCVWRLSQKEKESSPAEEKKRTGF